MSSTRRIQFILLAVLVISIFALYGKLSHWHAAALENVELPDPKISAHSRAIISSLPITDLDGSPATLPGTGKYRLINYWATWCGPCLAELPMLNEFSRSQTEKGIVVIGIALDESTDVREYLKQNPANYQQFLETAGDNDSSSQLGNNEGIIPFSVLIGPDGSLLKQKQGDFADLDELEVFAQPPKP